MKRIGPFKIEKYYDGYWSSKYPTEDFRPKEDPIISLEKKDNSNVWIATISNGPYSENEAYSISGSFNYCVKQLRENLQRAIS